MGMSKLDCYFAALDDLRWAEEHSPVRAEDQPNPVRYTVGLIQCSHCGGRGVTRMAPALMELESGQVVPVRDVDSRTIDTTMDCPTCFGDGLEWARVPAPVDEDAIDRGEA